MKKHTTKNQSAALKQETQASLTLVPGGGHAPKPPVRAIAAFLLLAIAAIISAIYYSNQKTSAWNRSLHTFFSLNETYTREGLESFVAQKELLRQSVEKTLQESHDEGVLREARNVAVYLFPELLDDTDFEKRVAIQEWAPMERLIEKRPTDPQSRYVFEDLKAGIWNYENPKRSQPTISKIAHQVILIYDTLSTP